MDQPQQPATPLAAPKPPMSAEQLVDLRARVLRGEAVSDDELRHALSSLAMARGTATATSTTGKSAKEPAYKPAGSLADRFKAFQSKEQKTDTSGTPVVDAPPPKPDNGQ